MRIAVAMISMLAAIQATPAKAICPVGKCDGSWLTSHDTMRAATDYNKGYVTFIDKARTELTTVSLLEATARKNGFTAWKNGTDLNAGQRYFHNNRGRAFSLIIGGKKSPSNGVRIVASHIDSPRLELKGRPVDSAEGFALFQTNYHGGIKTYQWTNIPLALIGRVDQKDGTVVEISVGLNAGDPIFIIPDLSPHTAKAQMAKSAKELIPHEALDPIAAHGPHGDNSAAAWVFKYLKATYGIEPNDLVSAELALVPAVQPRDVGFDRRLTAGYGQDDRLAAYASLQAALAQKKPDETLIISFLDNEEAGNVNNTGADSSYISDIVAELLYSELGDAYRQIHLKRALEASKALSIDVNPGVNPMDPGVWELTNAPRLGYGINIKLYGRGFNANSEYTAWLRAALDDKNIPWQTTTYKVGRAGGGTLGGELSRLNIDTIDIGVPILSIHTPYAISDKMDAMNLRDTIHAFLTYKR